MIKLPQPPTAPTFYFIGVTTGASSIMKVFPAWAKALGLGDVVMQGIDISIHAQKDEYRQCVSFIKEHPLALGALVTTHKIDLYHAASDLFAYLDPYAQSFGELSCISKDAAQQLCGHAKDPISSGLALNAFVPADHWKKTNAPVCILGAGGSALAISAYLSNNRYFDGRPSGVHLTNRSAPRLAEAVRILSTYDIPLSFHLCKTPEQNDAIVSGLPAGTLLINATGLGKDRPGSPLTDACVFPENGIVWELNYRGTLEFLHQAEAQQGAQNLLIEDGWTYFIHGWTQVIAEVFHIDITAEQLALCSEIGYNIRNGGVR